MSPYLTTTLSLVRHSIGHTLTDREKAVLGLLVEHAEPHTVRGMAAAVGVQKPVVTRAVDRLERDGLAKRRPDPADRRSVLLVATGHGRRLWGAVVRETAAAIRKEAA